jgi:hypothetical protein
MTNQRYRQKVIKKIEVLNLEEYTRMPSFPNGFSSKGSINDRPTTSGDQAVKRPLTGAEVQRRQDSQGGFRRKKPSAVRIEENSVSLIEKNSPSPTRADNSEKRPSSSSHFGRRGYRLQQRQKYLKMDGLKLGEFFSQK